MVTGREVSGLIRKAAESWSGVLARPGVTLRPSPERWSPLEYGCHVRDVLRLADARLQLMLIQSDPAFPNWDQDRTAVDADYASQNADAVAIGLIGAAARFTADLDEIRPSDWGRTARRSDGAVFSVDSFARYIVHDPIHHLADVAAGMFS
jgi:hypothetical protein